MEGEGQTAEAIRPDDPVKIRVDSGRQVVAWCQATGSLAKGSEPVHVIRVSFTNAETAESSGSPAGFGWFDVDPAQVLVDETTIDAAGLATC